MSTAAKTVKTAEEVGDIYVAITNGTIPGKFNDNRTMFRFPEISYTVSSGKLSTYNIIVQQKNENNEIIPIEDAYLQRPAKQIAGYSEILVESSVEGGKVRDIAPTVITAGKNLTKANATNSIMQAFKEAYSKYNKKFRETNPPADVFEPMSLDTINSSKQNVLTPDDFKNGIYVQYKLDGNRVVISKNSIYSRNLVQYLGFQHYLDQLKPLFEKYPDLYLDGEAYIHGMSLQEIGSIMRKDSDKKLANMVINIFDMFMPKTNSTMPYFERLKFLRENIVESVDFKLVNTIEVHSMEEIEKLAAAAEQEKYEGLVLRRANGIYEHRRSHSALKMKKRNDNEYKIVNFICGTTGKDANAIIWVCDAGEASGNKNFNVVPNMTLDNRKKLYTALKEHAEDYEKFFAGKYYTVEYAGLSDDNIPLQAKGKTFRTDIDMTDNAATNEYLEKLFA